MQHPGFFHRAGPFALRDIAEKVGAVLTRDDDGSRMIGDVQSLRDAGVDTGLAVGVALLYALSVVLLVIVEASFAGAISGQTGDAKAASGLELILLVSVIALLLSSAHYDATSAVVALLLAVEFIPIVLALGTTAWAASRPSREAQSA